MVTKTDGLAAKMVPIAAEISVAILLETLFYISTISSKYSYTEYAHTGFGRLSVNCLDPPLILVWAASGDYILYSTVRIGVLTASGDYIHIVEVCT